MSVHNGSHVVECWACKVTVAVPFLGGKPADAFKCGWCGALNELQQGLSLQHQQWQYRHHPGTPAAPGDRGGNSTQGVQMHLPDGHTTATPGAFALHLQSAQQQIHQRSKRGSSYKHYRERCSTACMQFWRWAVVVFVVLLVGSIAGTGIWMLLPRVCTTWATYTPNLMFAALLLFNVAFNYTAAVLQSPGRVTELVPQPSKGRNGEVPQGSFHLYTYCKPCRSPKPPQAHHCRVCGHCVVDMDHHCPFIANCVGRGNLRPFLLFLFWTLVAAAYTLLMCSILVWQQWEVVRSSASFHGGSGPGSINSATGVTSAFSNVSGLVLASTANISYDMLHTGRMELPATAASAAPGVVHFAATGNASPSLSGWFIASTGMLIFLMQLAPGWLLATYYLAAVAAALLLAISVLLYSQLSYLERGMTYIQHLKGGAAGAKMQDAPQQHEVAAGGGSNQLQCVPHTPGELAGSNSCSLAMGHESWHPQTHRQGKFRVLWLRIREVLGADSATSCLYAMVCPTWTAIPSAGPKKWT